MIDFTSGNPQDAATLRSVTYSKDGKKDIKIEIDQWNWDTATYVTYDITESVTAFSFSKTLSTPMGGGTLSMVPLLYLDGELKHVMDAFNNMDVIRITEFDVLKFQGYIRRIATKMSIASDGKPTRVATITMTHIGGLLQEAHLGFEVIAPRIKELDEKLNGYAAELGRMINAITSKLDTTGITITAIIKEIVDRWFILLAAFDSTKMYETYLKTYIDFEKGLASFSATKIQPSELSFFYGNDQQMALWAEISKLSETPFNEIFFDEGDGRVFWYSGASENKLIGKKTFLLGRQTPFDGTVRQGGDVQDFFKSIPKKEVKLKYITQFDLNKTSEESYSLYMAIPSYASLNEVQCLSVGAAEVDDAILKKYLLRTLQMKLFYRNIAQTTSTGATPEANKLSDEMKNAATTLKNWFANNDKFLSGVITVLVPSELTDDIYVGDAIKIEQVAGYFYVEGVTHNWVYGGALTSNLTVVRGYDYDNGKPIQLNHVIFTAASFPSKLDKQMGQGGM